MKHSLVKLLVFLIFSLSLGSAEEYVNPVKTKAYFQKTAVESKEIHYSTNGVKGQIEDLFHKILDHLHTPFYQSFNPFEKPPSFSITLKPHRSDAFMRLNILSSKHHPPTI
jgi:hypothetical protein